MCERGGPSGWSHGRIIVVRFCVGSADARVLQAQQDSFQSQPHSGIRPGPEVIFFHAQLN